MSDKKGTILLIEDNPDLRRIYADILTFDGYQVITAGDGEEGWEMAKTYKPEFILLDLEMPKLNGFEVLGLIRGDATTKNIPVIIFSAMHMQQDIQKALDMGANGYLTKGNYSPRYVLDRIRTVMANIAVGPLAKMAVEPPKAVDPSPKPGLPKIQIKEYREEEAGQWKETISMPGYRCPRCDVEMILEMFPGPEQDGVHWFYSRLTCPKCSVSF